MKVVHWLASVALVVSQMGEAPAYAATAEPGRPALTCDAAAIKAPADVTITSVKAFDAPVKYCRVDGYVTTRNPGPNTVGFMVALPAIWNGRWLYSVPGGAAGFVPDPSAVNLQRGYAQASTDKGSHASHILDFSFRTDLPRDTDWTHRGAHVAAIATQAITREYYGREKVWRYMTGCSGGGSSMMQEAELYPQDADAIIPAATSMSPGNVTFWGYLAAYLYKDPGRWISPDEMKRVGEVIMQTYDASDGAVDGLIWDPRKIVLKREMFPFLSDAQFGTLQVLQTGLPALDGTDIPRVGKSAPGYWMANPEPMVAGMLGATAPPWTSETQPRLFTVTDTGNRSMFGAAFNTLTDMDYSNQAQLEKEATLWKQVGGWDYDPGRLSALRDAHTKMLMWIGGSDSAVQQDYFVAYVDQADKAFGAARSSFLRFFIPPGVYHCTGGQNEPTNVPDVMQRAAEQWAETGKAPDFVIADNGSQPGRIQGGIVDPGVAGTATRTYRLCPYPQRSVFKGGLQNPDKLNVNDAINWSCEN